MGSKDFRKGYFRIADGFFEIVETTPERRLIVAIIERAVRDVLSNKSSNFLSGEAAYPSEIDKVDALRFLVDGEAKDLFDVIGLDGGYWVSEIKTFLRGKHVNC